MSGSGREDLLNVRESPGVVARPSRMSGSSREALPDVQVWSDGPPGCPEVVGKPSQMSGSGWEALPDFWECPGVVGRPYRMSGNVREGSGGPLGCP